MKYLFILFIACTPLLTSGQKNSTDSLERLAEKTETDTTKALILREIAFHYIQSEPGKSLHIARQIKELSVASGFRIAYALALDIEGNVFRLRGDYNKALNLHLQALQILDSIGDKKRYRSVLVNTATDHVYMKNYKQGLIFYDKALQLTDISESHRYVTILNNIGNVYSVLKQQEKAISIYMRALPIANTDSSYQMQSTIYSSLAIAYGESGRIDDAIRFMLQAIRFQELIGDKYHSASSASTLSEYYITRREYYAAEIQLQKAFRIATEIGAKSIIADTYKNRSLLHYKQGKSEQAYLWLHSYISLNDSLINDLHIAELAESQVRFDRDMQEKELALLSRDKELKEAQLERQKLWQIVLIVVLIAALILLLLIYRNMQLRKKLNASLQDENALLQKENILAQYETLRSQVNPHFLFNSLNALSSLIRTEPEKAIEFTSKFARLYRQVLEYKTDTLITLNEELNLARDYIYLQKIRFGEQLLVEFDVDKLSRSQKLPPFCLQMLLENAIKHNEISKEMPLKIMVNANEGILTVSNTLQARKSEESTGTGIRNIIERYKFSHETSPGFRVSGAEYIVELPLIASL